MHAFSELVKIPTSLIWQKVKILISCVKILSIWHSCQISPKKVHQKFPESRTFLLFSKICCGLVRKNRVKSINGLKKELSPIFGSVAEISPKHGDPRFWKMRKAKIRSPKNFAVRHMKLQEIHRSKIHAQITTHQTRNVACVFTPLKIHARSDKKILRYSIFQR